VHQKNGPRAWLDVINALALVNNTDHLTKVLLPTPKVAHCIMAQNVRNPSSTDTTALSAQEINHRRNAYILAHDITYPGFEHAY
jgi:hypothetical protein